MNSIKNADVHEVRKVFDCIIAEEMHKYNLDREVLAYQQEQEERLNKK